MREDALTKEEFCTYIRQYKLDLYRFAKSILGNEVDVEDAISETILKAYANKDQLKDKKKIKAWLLKIQVNECYKILRKQKRFVFCESLEKYSSSYEQEFIDSKEGEIGQYINKLRPKLRMVVGLYYYEDLTVYEISKILGISEGTVKSRLSRGREKLKKMLEEVQEGELQWNI